MEDKVLETVVNSIGFTFEKDILVKPLEPIKIKKKVTEMVPSNKKDNDGTEKYETKETIKDIESDFEKGIIIAIPTLPDVNFTIGDVVVYPKKFAKDFDLFKDSKLIKPYDIVAKSK